MLMADIADKALAVDLVLDYRKNAVREGNDIYYPKERSFVVAHSSNNKYSRGESLDEERTFLLLSRGTPTIIMSREGLGSLGEVTVEPIKSYRSIESRLVNIPFVKVKEVTPKNGEELTYNKGDEINLHQIEGILRDGYIIRSCPNNSSN